MELSEFSQESAIDFPLLPTFEAEWMPIYFEPITLSGERITLAVAALGKDGTREIRLAPREQVLKCLYGAKAKDVQEIYNWIEESLQEYLSAQNSFNGWLPPLSGISVGSVQRTFSDTIDGVIQQAIRRSASLGELAKIPVLEPQLEKIVNVKTLQKQFNKDVKELMSVAYPQFRDYCNVSFHAGKTFKDLRSKVTSPNLLNAAFTFFHPQHYAMNVIYLDISMQKELAGVKSKIFNLSLLKKYSADHAEILPMLQSCEVGFATKNSDDLSVREKQVLEDFSKSAQEIADHHGIATYKVLSKQQVTQRIIAKAKYEKIDAT
ncbi:MAG: hypothetical protein ACOVSW_07710 [Candidatus Kapaibacteriota bacterium]